MFEDKTMVADTLAGINGELMRFGEMIPQTENMQLKQVLKQIRNQCEQSQEEIYQIATSKQYYVPAAKDPMVYLVSHTWTNRFEKGRRRATIEAYSNCDSVLLFNGVTDEKSTFLGHKKNNGTGTHLSLIHI